MTFNFFLIYLAGDKILVDEPSISGISAFPRPLKPKKWQQYQD